MRPATQADERLEVVSHELGTIVRDDPWCGVGKPFPRPLDNTFDLLFLHGFTDFPVDNETAAAIQHAAQVVECATDIQVGNVHMPVFMRLQRLYEAGALAGRLGIVSLQQPGGFENAVHAGGATSHDVGIEHHESQATVAVERV